MMKKTGKFLQFIKLDLIYYKEMDIVSKKFHERAKLHLF